MLSAESFSFLHMVTAGFYGPLTRPKSKFSHLSPPPPFCPPPPQPPNWKPIAGASCLPSFPPQESQVVSS